MAIATGMALAAGLGAAGSIYSASQNRKAASRGAQAVTDASDQNIAESRRQFDINRQDLQPFIQSGYQRQSAQDQLLGLSPVNQAMPGQMAFGQSQGLGGQDFGSRNFEFGGYGNQGFDNMIRYDDGGQYTGPSGNFEETFTPGAGNQAMSQSGQPQQPRDPLAGFRQSGFYQINNDPRILSGVNAAYSAKGMGLDGSAQMAATRGLRDNLYGQFIDFGNMLGQGAAQGLGAAQNLGAMGMNMAQSNAANRNNAANAMASSYQQQAQANNQGVGGALGALQWYGGKRGWF